MPAMPGAPLALADRVGQPGKQREVVFGAPGRQQGQARGLLAGAPRSGAHRPVCSIQSTDIDHGPGPGRAQQPVDGGRVALGRLYTIDDVASDVTLAAGLRQ